MGEHGVATKASDKGGDHAVQAARGTGPTSVFQSALGNVSIQYLHETAPAILRACCSACVEDDGAPARADLSDLASSSSPLDAGVRTRAEADFGADFSGVRVHRDESSDRASRALNANAFTVGQDIFFRGTSYAPNSASGYRLLAHELTHTLQSPAVPSPSAELSVSTPGDAAERQAQTVSERISGGDVIDPASITKSAAAVRGDFLDDVSSMLGGAYDAASSAVSAAAGGIEDVAASAATAVTQGMAAIGSAVTSAASALSADPEETRANLISQVNNARSQVQSADPRMVSAMPADVASLNAKIGEFNSLAAAAVPMAPALVEAPAAAPEALSILDAFLAWLGEILEAIIAALLSAEAAVILIVVIIVIAIIAIIYYLLRGPLVEPAPEPGPAPAPPVPEPGPGPGPAPEPGPGPGPEPGPRPPRPPPPIPPPMCSFPTGLTPLDAIPMTWFKPRVDDFYPAEIVLAGDVYERDDTPTTLPHGEPIGVEDQYWPFVDKTFQLLPTSRGPEAGRFRAVLEGYGFDWSGLQADHVQDIEFEGPDEFNNLWPLDASANTSAGARTNSQTITYCPSPFSAEPISGTFAELKATVPGFYGRFFRIEDISR